MSRDNRWCLICQPRNRTLYWHQNDQGVIWCYCNKCDRGYSLEQYCTIADINMEEFLKGDFYMQEAQDNTVQAMAWPHSFIPLSDPRAEAGVNYIKSRGLKVDGDMYYDMNEEGIVFPYYVDQHFCGAQVRFLKERVNQEGDVWKITTLLGTRLGLLFYGWNQGKLSAAVKAVVVTEGAFNALAIQQAMNTMYGGIAKCPWRAIACSGSGATESQREALKELVDNGIKVIIAPDPDEAGLKMYEKFAAHGCATHYVFTNQVNQDWNDLLKQLGHKDLAKHVLQNITVINVG